MRLLLFLTLIYIFLFTFLHTKVISIQHYPYLLHPNIHRSFHTPIPIHSYTVIFLNLSSIYLLYIHYLNQKLIITIKRLITKLARISGIIKTQIISFVEGIVNKNTDTFIKKPHVHDYILDLLDNLKPLEKTRNTYKLLRVRCNRTKALSASILCILMSVVHTNCICILHCHSVTFRCHEQQYIIHNLSEVSTSYITIEIDNNSITKHTMTQKRWFTFMILFQASLIIYIQAKDYYAVSYKACSEVVGSFTATSLTEVYQKCNLKTWLECPAAAILDRYVTVTHLTQNLRQSDVTSHINCSSLHKSEYVRAILVLAVSL
ncbi:hypothetical protein GQR58_007607 [Nymphon striatum]|nr:hypothetical protein GQR58_007607 [Nymphon striatum]